MNKILELFSGTEGISNAFRNRGWDAFTIDWDESFPSSWHTDISKITVNDILTRFGIPDVIWIGTDCTTYSVAAISKHRKQNKETGNLDPISEYAKFCDDMNWNVRKIVDELQKLNPKLIYFWENPRGGFRKMNFIKDLPRYTITYNKYLMDRPFEERRMKPTDIFTNHPDPKFLPPSKNGDPDHVAAPRGARTGTQGIKGAKLRSKYPEQLCEHIANICCEVIGK